MINYEVMGEILTYVAEERKNKIPDLDRARRVNVQSEAICDALRSESQLYLTGDELKMFALRQAADAIILYESLY